MAASIEFLQLNLQKAKQARFELGQKIRSYNNKSKKFICLVQEPQLYGGRMAGQPKIVSAILFPQILVLPSIPTCLHKAGSLKHFLLGTLRFSKL